MEKDLKVRWGWLKVMYIYTIVSAGGTGLGMVLVPKFVQSVLQYPPQDPIVFGAFGCMLISSGILAILGLRSPLKFVPLLFFQLCYKPIWFVGVLLPFLLTNKLQLYVIMYVVVFAIFVIGDLIAIPFSHLFAKESK